MRIHIWVIGILMMVAAGLCIGWFRETRRNQTLMAERDQLQVELEKIKETTAATPVIPQTDIPKAEFDPSPQTPQLADPFPLRETPAPKLEDAGAVSNAQGTSIAQAEVTTITAPTLVASASTNEPLPYTKEQLEAYRCSNQTWEIALATQRWAMDHGGVTPTNLTELRDYIAPMILERVMHFCRGVV